MTSEEIGNVHKPHILTLLEAIRDEARRVGYHATDPEDMTDEEYTWSVVVHRVEGEGEGVDVRVTIAESEYHGDGEGGVNFALDVVAEGGSIIGSLIPYNYTEQVWVSRDDPAAVNYRWHQFYDGVDEGVVVESITRYFDKRKG